MCRRVACTMALCLLPLTLGAQTDDIHWVPGPKTVDLGRVAQLDLAEDHLFLGAGDARKLLEAMGNVPDGTELGLVTSAAEQESWFVIFEQQDVGYVRDDDRDEIDAEALLEGIREATEEANKVRSERGVPAIHVVGWQEAPHYDAVTHNLTWALIGRDDAGEESANFNVRLLGRSGYMSVTLVEDAAKLALTRPQLDRVVQGFSYKPGSTYAEFRSGDKVAQYGLAALVAGGAGAAAAKTGLLAAFGKLLAKAGKAVILLIVAALAAVRKVLRALFGTERSA